jgi:hypothetical protein
VSRFTRLLGSADEAADAVAAVDHSGGWRLLLAVASWWQQVEGTVRPLTVVMVDEDAQHLLEVAAVADQQPVGTFGADGADEPLGDRFRLRCPQRRLDDPNALVGEDGVEAAGELAVAVANQEADAWGAKTQVGRLQPSDLQAEPNKRTSHASLCGITSLSERSSEPERTPNLAILATRDATRRRVIAPPTTVRLEPQHWHQDYRRGRTEASGVRTLAQARGRCLVASPRPPNIRARGPGERR